jgi:hypothetical protein
VARDGASTERLLGQSSGVVTSAKSAPARCVFRDLCSRGDALATTFGPDGDLGDSGSSGAACRSDEATPRLRVAWLTLTSQS